VARAQKAGVSLLVLSDHDSVSGCPEGLAAAQGGALDLRCGVEINTRHGENVHILGYGIRWQDPGFLAVLAELRERRVRRLREMLEKLKALGFELTYDEVRGDSPDSLGRGHVADALRRKGVVSNRAEAFRRFLAQGKPAYVASLGPTVEEAIALIRGSGGFAVIAHPGTVADREDIEAWAKAGLEGIEVYYAGHSPSDILRFQDLADRLGLLVTGGSDYHGRGSGRDGPMGVEVPDEVGRAFLERLSRCG
jgi:3',5'-nucleoside bisphosphate phosphatase